MHQLAKKPNPRMPVFISNVLEVASSHLPHRNKTKQQQQNHKNEQKQKQKTLTLIGKLSGSNH